MGHKEDLLAGAKRCLYERGYSHTTTRDLVTASGTNLASIGYHYGSKDHLMNAAMISATEDWGAELALILASVTTQPASLLERFELIWTLILQTFEAHRPLWIATFEVFTQAQHAPEVRDVLADKLEDARQGMAALFLGLFEPVEDDLTRSVGAFLYALISGVISQWLIDPARAPTAQDLTRALDLLVRSGSQPATLNRVHPGPAH